MKIGWLVNDCLTCIPGTKTFWHDLLENIPGLEDKTYGYTDYTSLASNIETELKFNTPDYIIRNGSYFRKINTKVKTISLVQDLVKGFEDVHEASDVVVFNSPYVRAKSQGKYKRIEIIPLGVDFDKFCPGPSKANELGILPNSILFIGANNYYPKGFDVIQRLIQSTPYNFCLVMKDDYKSIHPRVKVFNRVNQDKIIDIMRSCSMLLCTSVEETQHLAGIEAAACGLPILASNVGVYHNRPTGEWGSRWVYEQFLDRDIYFILNNLKTFNPREAFKMYDKKNCMKLWNELVESL